MIRCGFSAADPQNEIHTQKKSAFAVGLSQNSFFFLRADFILRQRIQPL